MCSLAPPPFSPVEHTVDILHGVHVADPYRWLEDQGSARTRAWIEQQTQYARSYLDALPNRRKIRERVREFLEVETFNSILKANGSYVFRKRSPKCEQPGIFLRNELTGEDQLLIDPREQGTDTFTSVTPVRLSRDARLLLFEIKNGGQRLGMFRILEIPTRRVLSDFIPCGRLRGFEFTGDSKGFYYVLEPAEEASQFHRAAKTHVLGTSFEDDQEIFCPGDDRNTRLCLVANENQLGFLVYRFRERTYTDFYTCKRRSTEERECVLLGATYLFEPRFVGDRLLAITDESASNRRIIEVRRAKDGNPLFADLIPATGALIRDWTVAGDYILVSYVRGTSTQIKVFSLSGQNLGELPVEQGETVRLKAVESDDDTLFLERESFFHPVEIYHHSLRAGESRLWSRRNTPFDAADFSFTQVSFPAKDGTRIPMFLVGRADKLAGGPSPTIMTSYGGYGVPMTPQFSVLVAILMELGCIFALPGIRGGSEFGSEWYHAAKRQKRHVAFDDFLSAAEWLIESDRTSPERLGIFGGSNSGLLVAAAMTRRPELFRAVLCLVPLLDMLRFHLFDNSYIWKDEFGTADDPNDFVTLREYSPYHHVHDGCAYPATMIVSGDADQKCNPLHARKMTARLQAANSSGNPIFLDYHPFRGHSPVLPLSVRIDALTDRLAFFCHELSIRV